MSQAEVRPTNFIRQIIDEDLNSGKHTNVHTRFPPEPNGFLHIGHAKSICLNFGIADDYQGQCNLRFDDTNPEKEDINYVNAIQEDVKWLGFNWDGKVRYSSSYFDKLFEYAVELIQAGKAYVCFLNAEETRTYRGTLQQPGTNSPYRETSIKENLALFNKMRDGGFADGECCLRAKIDMASSFMCMRDPVIYRIKRAHHHQTGDKWCIYPMYDFTHCISDAIEGISHSICTLEFQDNRRVYDWVLDNISIDCRPRQYEFSRLNLEYTLMSKRKLNALVAENHVTGWDDPRMPTIAGLRRRGYTPAAIREFCKRIGVTKQNNTIEIGMLEACIREDLGDSAPRAMAVLDPVKLVITNYPEGQVEQLIAPAHPKLDMGNRTLPFAREIFIDRADFREEANKKYKRLVLGKEVRLRNAYVIKADDVIKDEAGNIIELHCSYDDQTLGKNPADGRKVKGVIHWVAADFAVDAEVRLYNHLFNVADPAAFDSLEETLNPESLVVLHHAKVEPSLVAAVGESVYQFEREGYFCVDSKDSSADKLVFNRTVSLRGE